MTKNGTEKVRMYLYLYVSAIYVVAPVIYQCDLTRDLSLFEAGDATEVGERGLTLR